MFQLEITDAAAHALASIGGHHPDEVLRIRVQSLCECGKMGFDLTWEPQPQPGDVQSQCGPVTIVVDSQNRPMVDGAHIDYLNAIMEKKFIITHPLVVTECQGPSRSH